MDTQVFSKYMSDPKRNNQTSNEALLYRVVVVSINGIVRCHWLKLFCEPQLSRITQVSGSRSLSLNLKSNSPKKYFTQPQWKQIFRSRLINGKIRETRGGFLYKFTKLRNFYIKSDFWKFYCNPNFFFFKKKRFSSCNLMQSSSQ